MSDLLDQDVATDEIQKPEPADENIFRAREFPSDEDIRKLYESEISQEAALSPISITYYLDNDERDFSLEENSDLKGALEDQKKMFELFSSPSVTEGVLKELVTIIQSSSGWKEIADILKDPQFGEKTLEYLKKAQATEKQNNQKSVCTSLEKTAKLIGDNLNFFKNGA